MNNHCPQCGARLQGHTNFAEQLHRMLLSGGIAPAGVTQALAQFALSHPMTYSTEALQVAADLLVRTTAPALDEEEAAPNSAGAMCRWWRHFARRMSCH